jgi:hypothetical protein
VVVTTHTVLILLCTYVFVSCRMLFEWAVRIAPESGEGIGYLWQVLLFVYTIYIFIYTILYYTVLYNSILYFTLL